MIYFPEPIKEALDIYSEESIDYEILFDGTRTVFYNGINILDMSDVDPKCEKPEASVSRFFTKPQRRRIPTAEYFGKETYNTKEPYFLFDTQTKLNYICSKKIYNGFKEGTPFFTLKMDVNSLGMPNGALTFYFGTDENIYPTFFKITTSTGYSVDCYPTSNIFSLKGMPKSGTYTLTMEVYKMSKVGHKLTLSGILFGEQILIKSEQIKSISVKRSSNPFSTEMPKNEMKVEIVKEPWLSGFPLPKEEIDQLLGYNVELYCFVGESRTLLGTYKIFDYPIINEDFVEISAEGKTTGALSRSDFHVPFTDAFDTSDTKACFSTFLSNLEQLYEITGGDMENLKINAKIPNDFYYRDYKYVKDGLKDEIVKMANSFFGIITEDRSASITIEPTFKYELEAPTIHVPKEFITDDIVLDTNAAIQNGIKVFKYSNGTGNENGFLGRGDFVVKNNYIVDDKMAQYLVDTYKTGVMDVKKYTIPCFPLPHFEVGDYINFTDESGRRIVGIIAENNYSFPYEKESNSLAIYGPLSIYEPLPI